MIMVDSYLRVATWAKWLHGHALRLAFRDDFRLQSRLGLNPRQCTNSAAGAGGVLRHRFLLLRLLLLRWWMWWRRLLVWLLARRGWRRCRFSGRNHLCQPWLFALTVAGDHFIDVDEEHIPSVKRDSEQALNAQLRLKRETIVAQAHDCRCQNLFDFLFICFTVSAHCRKVGVVQCWARNVVLILSKPISNVNLVSK